MIEIINTKDKGFVFNVKAENGTVLLNSIGFSSEQEVKEVLGNLNGIKETANTFERKTNYNGKFLFNVKSDRGQIIGNSQLYTSEAGMENGIKNLKNRIALLAVLNVSKPS